MLSPRQDPGPAKRPVGLAINSSYLQIPKSLRIHGPSTPGCGVCVCVQYMCDLCSCACLRVHALWLCICMYDCVSARVRVCAYRYL